MPILEANKTLSQNIPFWFDDKKIRSLSDKENILARVLLKIGGQYQVIREKDSAIKYYQKILSNPLRNKIIKAGAYTNLSGIYREDSIYELSKQYSKKAIEVYKKANNKVLGAAALGNLASIYLEEKKYDKAQKTYLEGINLIKLDSSNKATKYKEHLFYNLAYTLYLQKDYKAYDYQEKSYTIKDGLRDIEIRRIVEEIYTDHKLNLEKEKTALVEEQRKLIEAKDQKASLLFATLSLLIFIISGVIIYNYKLRQNNLQLKLSESKLLQQQDIERLKSETHVKILNATIDGKETERKQIAETLHDSVSALLSSANMHLTATKNQISGVVPEEIEKTQTIILDASKKVRDLSHNLMSSILLKFGLEYAINDVAKKYSNSEINFFVIVTNINRYNQDFEIRVFNVLQELINNVIKHSKASASEICLLEKEEKLHLKVKDDGVGFSVKSSSLKDGIGLNQIEARIQMMNGVFNIETGENSGTEISIIIPIVKKGK